MSDVVIKVENLGKKYIIGHQKQERYTALRDVVAEGVKSIEHRLRGKKQPEDPTQEEFWALKDVSFEVKQGDRVGIIGRNGAGKSTLLKILSRITEPTEGRINIKGRVASLLEVGTGFHPELTGRENIFLNGAILGMSRVEIARKFDEIVAFAEVEKFLDTPVKRYSSGMYVRLAFAVAAHLEPEILIVDEVLAVGDAQFQKKCLGKMEDVATKEGRTILFVSHNVTAIQKLTNRCCYLKAGQMLYVGTTEDAIQTYTESYVQNSKSNNKNDAHKGNHTSIDKVCILDKYGNATNVYDSTDKLTVEILLHTDGHSGLSLECFLITASGEAIALSSTDQFYNITLPREQGQYLCTMSFKPLYLASGSYALNIATSLTNIGWDVCVEHAVYFDVLFSNPNNTSWDFKYSYGYGSIPLLFAEELKFKKTSSYL